MRSQLSGNFVIYSFSKSVSIEFSISRNIPTTFHRFFTLARTNLEEGANPGGKLIDVSPPFSNGIKDLRRQTNRFYNLYSFIEAFTAAIPLLPSLGQMVRPRFRSVYALESGNKISCGIYLSIRRV